MLVYGDAERLEDFRDKRDAVAVALAEASRLRPGLERHAALVAASMEASEWVQGLADAMFEARGCDALSAPVSAAMRCLVGLGSSVGRSWTSGFAEADLPPWLAESLRTLEGPETIRTKQAEGYAFYALYPELFIEAARRSGLPPDTRVIGIRSIGTGLAALVAAAFGARPPVTVRPVGHPFRREVRIDPELGEDLVRGASTFAIVDEGPGLSGSSFGAVLDWLEGQGVARERIHVFPSHRGDLGPQASDEHRRRWAQLERHVVSFEEVLPSRLQDWCEALLGPLDAPLEDVSGGGWRCFRYAEEGAWPAANPQQERRKYRARAGGGETWLLKFAGLGREGERKLDLARRLAEAGFTPPSKGLCHGFLVERWIGEARSLDQAPVDRRRLIERIGAYCAFRARLPAGDLRGASAEELVGMARHNTRLALGEEMAARLRFDPAALEPRVRRVVTDNRMMPHEWLVAGGRILKADALDHHAAHDLVGCQDIAWDVVGAAVEFELSAEETAHLAAIVGREADRPVDPDLLRFFEPCYLAFQLGAATLAAQANGGPEARRLDAAAERYRTALSRVLDAGKRCS